MNTAANQTRRSLLLLSAWPPCLRPHHLSKLLRSCTGVFDLYRIHAAMIKTGIDLLPFPAAKLLAAAALIDVSHAFSLFRCIPSPTLFAFNTVLRAHSISPDPNLQESFHLFNSIRAHALPLDQFSFITTLKVCSRKLAICPGEQLHCLASKVAFDYFLNLRNILLHFYCVCGRICHAHQLFEELPCVRDAVSYSSMLVGYDRASQPLKVIALLRDMLECEVVSSSAAIITAFSAFADAYFSGESLHGNCIKAGLVSDLRVSTAIANMYVKHRTMEHARRVFEEMPTRDVVLYNCIMDGYAKEGSLDKCLVLLQQMRAYGVKPNASTLVGLLAACASFGKLALGRLIHQYANEENLHIEASLGTALMDMYIKNGCLGEAVAIFDGMQDRDVKAWTTMIMGFGVHGSSEDALKLFKEMEETGLRPNEVTLLAVLSSCTHGGLVDLGKELFMRIVEKYRLCPGIEHYGCIVDLLGRAGRLGEAYDFMKGLPFGGDAMAWRALLAACRVHGEVRIGELARETLVAMGKEHCTDAILLSSCYAVAGRWMEFIQARDPQVGGKMTLSKEAGCSYAEMVYG